VFYSKINYMFSIFMHTGIWELISVANFWVLMALKDEVEVFCVVVGYQDFGGPCFVDLWHAGVLPQNYTASQPRRPRLQNCNDYL
jgi:hypothetical protein